MEGLLSESGPYKVQQFSDPISLAFNPYTWNNKTNNRACHQPLMRLRIASHVWPARHQPHGL